MQGHTRGFVQITGPLGVIEHETFTCCHCNRIAVAPLPNEPPQDVTICHRCMQPTCPECTAKGGCDPFEKKLLRMEAAGRAR